MLRRKHEYQCRSLKHVLIRYNKLKAMAHLIGCCDKGCNKSMPRCPIEGILCISLIRADHMMTLPRSSKCSSKNKY